MTAFDVAVVGAPFLDLTFAGLPRLPGGGEEVVARELHVGPGGTGAQAVSAARLGLSVALVAPVGDDPAGEVLRTMLASEGVEWIGPRTGATATTAVLTTPDGTAMATALGGGEPTAEEVAAAEARAVVVSLGRLPLAPPGARVYVTTGSIELAAGAAAGAGALGGIRALILNEAEARRVTGRDDPAEAARHLAGGPTCVVVTLGADGALAVEEGSEARTRLPRTHLDDATGAGDLFVGAYLWADLSGMGAAERISWASLYATASLSAGAPAHLGALTLEPFLELGRRAGLSHPP